MVVIHIKWGKNQLTSYKETGKKTRMYTILTLYLTLPSILKK